MEQYFLSYIPASAVEYVSPEILAGYRLLLSPPPFYIFTVYGIIILYIILIIVTLIAGL